MTKTCRGAALLALLLLTALCLSGCGTKQTIHLYVNGDLTESLTLAGKETFAAAEPACPGYRFAGWYTEEDTERPYDSSAGAEKELSLYAGFEDPFCGGITFHPEERTDEILNDAVAGSFELGRVEAVAKQNDDWLVRAVGNYGLHLDQSPTVTVGVRVHPDSSIAGIWFLDSYAQTEGFPELITADYLQGSYEGEYAVPNMRVKPVTGASYTSQAVLYAVQTAANYLEQACGVVAETTTQELEALTAVFPADYTPASLGDAAVTAKVGSVQFAAEGITADGGHVLAMKVEGAQSFNYDGAYRSPYDSSKPAPFVMIIVCDCDSREVLAYETVIDGTNCEFFMLPQTAFDAYLGTVIDTAEVYDDFTDGLVKNYDGDWEFSMDDYNRKTITGTSILYTGATVDGTFSGQMLRNCYRTAARYFCDFIS